MNQITSNILTAIITALIIGSGFYWLLSQQNQKLAQTQQEIIRLRQQTSPQPIKNNPIVVSNTNQQPERTDINNNAQEGVNDTDRDQTSSWKTYNNQDLGLSFEYPNQWGEVIITIEKGEPGTAFLGKLPKIKISNSVGFLKTT